MMRNLKLFGAMLVFLVSLESCKGCAVGADAPFTGTCPTGQINIDDGKTSAATSCKAVVAVANKNDLVAEIKKATAGGNWTANLNYIDTSKVTDMSFLFADKAQTSGLGGNDLEAFNGRIDKWNTSNVTNMRYMFRASTAFNQPIGNWHTNNVTDMSRMFASATAFNQDIGNWNVSNVTNMDTMFGGAVAFNQPIGDWKVDNVRSMFSMFTFAVSFNQPIGNWNVSKVTNMRLMFGSATAFNQDIGNWKTGNVTTMESMFYDAVAFDQPIGNWNVSKVTDMQLMFGDATAFDKDLSQWTPTAVSSANMDNMFAQTAMETNNNFGKHAPWYCTTTGTTTNGC